MLDNAVSTVVVHKRRGASTCWFLPVGPLQVTDLPKHASFFSKCSVIRVPRIIDTQRDLMSMGHWTSPILKFISGKSSCRAIRCILLLHIIQMIHFLNKLFNQINKNCIFQLLYWQQSPQKFKTKFDLNYPMTSCLDGQLTFRLNVVQSQFYLPVQLFQNINF